MPVLKLVDNEGEILHFSANNDHNTKKKTILPHPIVARYIRIYPESWIWNGLCLRFEIYGCGNIWFISIYSIQQATEIMLALGEYMKTPYY